MKNKRRITVISVVSILLLTTAFVLCAKQSGFGNSDDSPLIGNDSNAKAADVQKAFNDIYDLYSESVVFISTEQTVQVRQSPFFNDPFFNQFFGYPDGGAPRTQKRSALGTGFVISEDGYICTNNHVIKEADKVTVKIGNKSYKAEIVGADARTDIALLKISSNAKFKPAYFGDSDKVKIGDWAIAIGNPFGLDKTFTVGIISATGRKDVEMLGGSRSLIQTDASINQGNSGGPLININGEVIGVNEMIYSQSGGSIGIGFAIPINTVKTVLDQLKTHKKVKRGYLGVSIVPLSEEYAQQLSLKNTDGALVGGIVEDSPAAIAGLLVGDVILKVNGDKIENYGDLIGIVDDASIGSTLKMVVWRRGKEITLSVTIKERP